MASDKTRKKSDYQAKEDAEKQWLFDDTAKQLY